MAGKASSKACHGNTTSYREKLHNQFDRLLSCLCSPRGRFLLTTSALLFVLALRLDELFIVAACVTTTWVDPPDDTLLLTEQPPSVADVPGSTSHPSKHSDSFPPGPSPGVPLRSLQHQTQKQIHSRQFPDPANDRTACKRLLLVSSDYGRAGFGSSVWYYRACLVRAMDEDRTMVLTTSSPFLDYIEPWSNCTYDPAIHVLNVPGRGKNTANAGKNANVGAESSMEDEGVVNAQGKSGRERMDGSVVGDTYDVERCDLDKHTYRYFWEGVPVSLRHLGRFWWNTQSMAFLLRMKEDVVHEYEKMGFPKAYAGFHVRRGDKVGMEGVAVHVRHYLRELALLHVSKRQYQKDVRMTEHVPMVPVFIATDDEQVVFAEFWQALEASRYDPHNKGLAELSVTQFVPTLMKTTTSKQTNSHTGRDNQTPHTPENEKAGSDKARWVKPPSRNWIGADPLDVLTQVLALARCSTLVVGFPSNFAHLALSLKLHRDIEEMRTGRYSFVDPTYGVRDDDKPTWGSYRRMMRDDSAILKVEHSGPIRGCLCSFTRRFQCHSPKVPYELGVRVREESCSRRPIRFEISALDGGLHAVGRPGR